MAIQNRPSLGLKNIKYAVLTGDTYAVAPSYGTIYALDDAVTMSFNPQSGFATLATDDNPQSFVMPYEGDGTLELVLADVTPDHYARLTGATYDDGITIEKLSDVSPWVAVGGTVTLDSGYQAFVWYYKTKFMKASSEDTTKTPSPTYRTKTLSGRVSALAYSTYQGQSRIKVRTDDTDASASFIAGFFNAVPLVSGANLSALLVDNVADGTLGVIEITFDKFDAGNFVLNAASFVTGITVITTAGVLQTVTWTADSVTPATSHVVSGSALAAGNYIVIIDGVKDTSGITVTKAIEAITLVIA